MTDILTYNRKADSVYQENRKIGFPNQLKQKDEVSIQQTPITWAEKRNIKTFKLSKAKSAHHITAETVKPGPFMSH